jgi:hypothetical protein
MNEKKKMGQNDGKVLCILKSGSSKPIFPLFLT